VMIFIFTLDIYVDFLRAPSYFFFHLEIG
jgi:hypothetical protein